MEEEYKILRKGLADMTKLWRENHKHYECTREELEMIVTMMYDIIEHTNVFLIELKEV